VEFQCVSNNLCKFSVLRLCEECYGKYKDKNKLNDKRERILTAGFGVRKELLECGDEIHYPERFDKIGVLYEMRILGKVAVVDSTALRGGRPIWFESGCSGPCIHVQVLGANRVYQASALDVPDPYCAVYWEGTFAGATQVVDSTVEPVWTGETFVVPVVNPVTHWVEGAALRGNKRSHSSSKYMEPLLRFEVFDHNTFFKDVFVGQVSLSAQQIVKVLAEGDSESRIYPLRPMMPTGTMRVTAAQTIHITTGMSHVIIKVEACKELSRSTEMSQSDKYLSAFWDTRPLGESPIARNSSNPQWENCIFHFPLPDVAKNCEFTHSLAKKLRNKTLLIQVREYAQIGEHSVLGEVEFDGTAINQLVKRSAHATDRAPPRKEMHRTLTSNVVPRTKNSLSSFTAGCCSCETLLYGHHRIAMGSPKSSSLQQEPIYMQSKLATSKSVSVRHLREVGFAPALEVPLSLGNAHNGSRRVRGSLGVRLIYHTRGKVIRGVDVGVEQMSLGERARLIVRPDYGFDTVRPGPKIPPGSELDIIVDLVSIAGHTSWFTYAQKALNGKFRIYKNKFSLLWEHFEAMFPRMGICLAKLGRIIYRCELIIFKCICLFLLCMCRAGMKFGEKTRREKREKMKRQREAAILARAESSVSFLHGRQDDLKPEDTVSEDTDLEDAPSDLMDINDSPTEVEEKTKRIHELASARSLFSRKAKRH
jgi:hypothetical protein